MTLFLEAKPEIKSYGELIRQLNFYESKLDKEFEGRAVFGVLTNSIDSVGFMEPIIEQGFLYVVLDMPPP